MAKPKKTVKPVALISPTGVRVTVAEESAPKFRKQGYKSPKPAAKKQESNSPSEKQKESN